MLTLCVIDGRTCTRPIRWPQHEYLARGPRANRSPYPTTLPKDKGGYHAHPRHQNILPESSNHGWPSGPEGESVRVGGLQVVDQGGDRKGGWQQVLE